MDNRLQFAHIEYSITTRSIDIFNNGCDGCCKGCCNTEIKNWNLKGIDPQQVILKTIHLLEKFSNVIDRIILVGGDPVDAYKHYPKEYLEFVQQIKLDKPIYLFTRHELEDIPKELLKEVDYVKTGAYISELTCDDNIQYGIKLATLNQKIHKVSELEEVWK